MAVTLRQRKLIKGKTRFFLDIWNPATKKRSYEFLFYAKAGEKSTKKNLQKP